MVVEEKEMEMEVDAQFEAASKAIKSFVDLGVLTRCAELSEK